MITAAFFAFLGLVVMVGLGDWKRAWLLAIIAATMQDAIRKLTPGTPVWISFTMVLVYGALLFFHQAEFRAALNDFARRFAGIWSAFGFIVITLAIAFFNGLMTFGVTEWKAPVLSLFTYVAPLPAILLGYAFADSERRLLLAMRVYAGATAVALLGSLMEYLRMDWRTLGLVAQPGDYIRHLPGIQIRMISGFYRAPDIMATHGATLTAISIAMAVREGISRRAAIWMALAGWGFFNCMISGRRKAIYFVIVFAIVFVLLYFRRLNIAQFAAMVAAGLVIAYVVRNISSNELTSVYARGATATRLELTGRLEGGLTGTIQQSGILGDGLGSATQGVYHVLSNRENVGWQEGGLGKLTRELGLPGIGALALVGALTLRLLWRISTYADEPATSQILRVALFGLVVANIANFVASAQTYSDPFLTLMAAFFTGCLFATAALEDRMKAAAAVRRPLAYAPA